MDTVGTFEMAKVLCKVRLTLCTLPSVTTTGYRGIALLLPFSGNWHNVGFTVFPIPKDPLSIQRSI